MYFSDAIKRDFAIDNARLNIISIKNKICQTNTEFFMDATLLTPEECKKGIFVLLKESKDCFEIGIVNEEANSKELKIWVLTAGAFSTNPPVYDEKIKNPFLPNSNEMIALDAYPIYPLDANVVIELLNQQKPETQAELEAFERMEESLMNLCMSK